MPARVDEFFGRDVFGRQIMRQRLPKEVYRRLMSTIQHGELLDPIRQRLQRHDARLRRYGPDYQAYAIIDTVIDALTSSPSMRIER